MSKRNKLLHPIEMELLNWFIKDLPKAVSKSIQSQIDLIVDIDREFTGQGAFISFKLKNNNYLKITDDSFTGLIWDGIALYSDELLHESPVHIVIEKDGKIDYLEFEFGFLKKEYPQKYELKEIEINSIKDKKCK